MLISDAYRQQQQQMHGKEYGGVHSTIYLPLIRDALEQCKAREVLDYGAGKGHLGVHLLTSGWTGEYYAYDPAVPEFARPPRPRDFVCCVDVLEHIEPDCLDAVLDDLKRLTKRAGLISVHLRPAKKTLPDGRNAHLIQREPDWWRKKLAKRFRIVNEQPTFNPKYEPSHIGHIFGVEALQ